MIWISTGAIGSFLLGILFFVIKNVLSGNATKANVSTKTDLLAKDIQHLNKDMTATDEKISQLHKRITDLRESSTEIYVSRELFHQTIQQLNEKLDTILKFLEK